MHVYQRIRARTPQPENVRPRRSWSIHFVPPGLLMQSIFPVWRLGYRAAHQHAKPPIEPVARARRRPF
jgi:hypothetical protein